mmetsp:Transcript_19587/g.55226  ORF Transcript_19587/g.55226 Transcript_19587/m.55226 type:complete len:275 (+) Transcript_19587:96-920(+)
MVFLDESRASWLFGALHRSASEEKKAPSGPGKTSYDSERAFDIADCMENGLARELVADFTQPLQHASKLWKFQVERSKDRQQFRMFCESGEFLMSASVSKDGRRVAFFLYDPCDNNALYDPDRPAFTMTCDSGRTEWRLVQERCDDCHYGSRHCSCSSTGRREVLSVRHSRQMVGDGINHCMEVHIAPTANYGEQLLSSKLPVWNDEVGSLVMDFKGRRVVASAKNFQLARAESPNHVVCQHGKIGANTFGLDFKYPLTVIQAFSISLTTLFWA